MSSDDVRLITNTGRFVDGLTNGQVAQSSSGFGALRVSQVDQRDTELTRSGRRYHLCAGAATGRAPVQAVPTTTAAWVLWNTSTTHSLVFDSVGMLLASGTAAAGQVVLGAIFSAPAQTGLATSVTVSSASRDLPLSAVAVKSNVTITAPTSPSWFVVAKNDSANTTVLQVAAVSDLNGRLIIPPLRGLALSTLSGTGTSPLFVPVATWTESAQDLE